MRTVKRESLFLNKEKYKDLEDLCIAYSREKKDWLKRLEKWEFQALLDNPRKLRDDFVKQSYTSRYGLQNRQWKLALEDACETWTSYWAAIFVGLRRKIANAKMTEAERRYAYWLIKGFSQFAELMQRKKPKLAENIIKEFSEASLSKVQNFIRKKANELRKKSPNVKQFRIAKFDANCYSIFEHNGMQYIKLMSLQPRKRIIVPLKGKTKIEGNLTLVLAKTMVYVHVSQDLKEYKLSKKGAIEAIDFGYTEVMTNAEGCRFGTQLGEILTQASDRRCEKGQKRNKIHAIEKKHRLNNPQKARRMRKNNLGRKKLNITQRKVEANLEREINSAINKFIDEKNPDIVITEDLSHHFTYDKSKKINRRLSSWVRGKLQERVAFKALAEGFCHEQVTPAYGSQLCPICGFVDKNNRKGDRFLCQHCAYESIADRVAALNYLKRYGDEEIGLYTPYCQVKTILLRRFQRRLEEGQPSTVPGRTLDIAGKDPRNFFVAEYAIAGRGNSI
jgi:putative transposase